MDARRSVGAARRSKDRNAEAAARSRVDDAEVALGERGEPWWEPPTDGGRRVRLAAAMRTLARHRAPDGSTCPSDVARSVGGTDWRAHMATTRDVARHLADEGEVEIRQKGVPVNVDGAWHGPVRIAARREADATSVPDPADPRRRPGPPDRSTALD